MKQDIEYGIPSIDQADGHRLIPLEVNEEKLLESSVV